MSIERFLNMQMKEPNQNLFNRAGVLKKELTLKKTYLKSNFVITYLPIQQIDLWLLTVLQFLKVYERRFGS